MEEILIVEDERGIADFLQLELEHEGFKVETASTGRQGLELYEKSKPDLILLDIMLPEISGLEVLRRIRKTSKVPVILVTARTETYDKVNGLNAGADDYISKPFEIEELLARMRAVMRRTIEVTGAVSILHVRNLELNINKMEVVLQKKVIDLSKTEFLLLKTLMENKNTVLSRDKIITEVWGDNHYIEENSVDVYVRYLRSKIDDTVDEEYISTVRGAGYMIKDNTF